MNHSLLFSDSLETIWEVGDMLDEKVDEVSGTELQVSCIEQYPSETQRSASMCLHTERASPKESNSPAKANVSLRPCSVDAS
ncbi:hypothetical protein LguiB_027779 [Lonicera macranthoides]